MPDSGQEAAMLAILHATCLTAIDAFDTADNAVDPKLLIALEDLVERTRTELERIGQR
jgi:hypothetical protein